MKTKANSLFLSVDTLLIKSKSLCEKGVNFIDQQRSKVNSAGVKIHSNFSHTNCNKLLKVGQKLASLDFLFTLF